VLVGTLSAMLRFNVPGFVARLNTFLLADRASLHCCCLSPPCGRAVPQKDGPSNQTSRRFQTRGRLLHRNRYHEDGSRGSPMLWLTLGAQGNSLRPTLLSRRTSGEECVVHVPSPGASSHLGDQAGKSSTAGLSVRFVTSPPSALTT
jgi:hypothetical protein